MSLTSNISALTGSKVKSRYNFLWDTLYLYLINKVKRSIFCYEKFGSVSLTLSDWWGIAGKKMRPMRLETFDTEPTIMEGGEWGHTAAWPSPCLVVNHNLHKHAFNY